jgi:hypothetical protein
MICRAGCIAVDALTVGGEEGSTAAYANGGGGNHQTTLQRLVHKNEVVIAGFPSTEHRYFPGYSWYITSLHSMEPFKRGRNPNNGHKRTKGDYAGMVQIRAKRRKSRNGKGVQHWLKELDPEGGPERDDDVLTIEGSTHHLEGNQEPGLECYETSLPIPVTNAHRKERVALLLLLSSACI